MYNTLYHLKWFVCRAVWEDNRTLSCETLCSSDESSDEALLVSGQWGVPWSWTRIASAGRPNVWRASRPSSARPSRRSSTKLPRAPSWACENVNTSSAFVAGTVPARTSTLAKSSSKVSICPDVVKESTLPGYPPKLINLCPDYVSATSLWGHELWPWDPCPLFSMFDPSS